MKTLVAVAAALILASPVHAAVQVYQTVLSGPAESPANASPGIGFGVVTFDSVAHLLTVSETFSGLVGTTTASHIHCCTALPNAGTAIVATMVPTFSLLPLGVTNGTFTQSFDSLALATYNSAFITASGDTAAGAEAALFAGLNAGESYLNIHTSAFPGGEIRGFLAPIPEPETYALMLMGLGSLGLAARRRKNSAAECSSSGCITGAVFKKGRRLPYLTSEPRSASSISSTE